MNLENKLALITGGAKGIGYEMTMELIKAGCSVVIIDKDEETLYSMKKELPKVKEVFACDLSSEIQLQTVIDQVIDNNLIPDVFISNAGIGIYKPIEEVSVDEWRDSFLVNMHAPFIITKALLNQGKIDNKEQVFLYVGSVCGVDPISNRVSYCATKFGLRGMVLTLAQEYEGKNTHFSILTLGSTLTEFGPLSISEKIKLQKQGKKYFTPDWVAKHLVELIMQENIPSEIVLKPEDI